MVCSWKRPSNLRDEPSSTVSAAASPMTRATAIGIAVAGEDGVDGSPETHHAPAHVERLDRERQDDVVVSFERGRAHAFAAPRHQARIPFCA